MDKQFYCGQKVVHKDQESVLQVEAVGAEQEWPGKGKCRKVYVNGAGNIFWYWDFELEAW